MERIARAFYGIFGVLALAAGAAVLAAPSLLSGPEDPPVLSHLLREEAAAFVFIGLMCVWAFRDPAARRPVHFALLVFTGLFAAIHWAEYFKDFRHIASPILNSIPSAILLLTAPRKVRA
jgi:hypothetical protein